MNDADTFRQKIIKEGWYILSYERLPVRSIISVQIRTFTSYFAAIFSLQSYNYLQRCIFVKYIISNVRKVYPLKLRPGWARMAWSWSRVRVLPRF